LLLLCHLQLVPPHQTWLQVLLVQQGQTSGHLPHLLTVLQKTPLVLQGSPEGLIGCHRRWPGQSTLLC
jgi:hypothetical protein